MTPTFIKRLHRDERGFLSPIILYMTIALALMIVWILNTGQMIYDKQRTQDTADAAALVHADWEARYLNIMAMNNVASSQATVVMATSVAFQLTTAELALRSTAILAKLAQYSFTEGFEWRRFCRRFRRCLIAPAGKRSRSSAASSTALAWHSKGSGRRKPPKRSHIRWRRKSNMTPWASSTSPATSSMR